MAEETKGALMAYEARDGQTIQMTFDTIKRYLVQGHPEYVTMQELMYFYGVCKSRGMNPFKRDCYLIKYSQKDSAAIITSIDFLRSRAKAMRDCKGWKCGIILERNGDVVYSNGLMLSGDKLLGGWAKAKPEGWEEEVSVEVNLNGYIKRTREGNITEFWKPEKQPTQIAKVAESQLIRKCWPDEFQNLYTDAEISPDNEISPLPEIEEQTGESAAGEGAEPNAHEEFDTSIGKLEGINPEHLEKYLELVASKLEITVYEAKDAAVQQRDAFLEKFKQWQEKNYPTEGKEEKGEPGQEPQKPEREDDPIRKEYVNLKSAGFSTWIHTHLEYIPKLDTVYQEEIKAKWEKLYPENTYPLDKEENAATGEISHPEESEEGTEQPRIEGKEDEAPIVCNNANALPGDRVTQYYCENVCRFREDEEGKVCEDYLKYIESLEGKE